MRRVLLLLPVFFLAGLAHGQEPPMLVVLDETGEERDGLPVYTSHADPGPATEALTQGFSAEWLSVYRMEQRYLAEKEGTPIEPAYVLLSSHQGGYARKGFILDGVAKPEAAYVDVYRGWRLSGAFGAIDQIVPHELAHAIRRQLVGELRPGGTNQIHALSVRTDRVVAFNEGFAEHLQAVAFEHSPDVPAMDSLARDVDRRNKAFDRLERYTREVSALFAPAPPLRLGFVLWFSNDEDVLRYHAVRENAFARAPVVPERLLRRHPYRTYLIENVSIAPEDAPLKSPARMAASEGVISAFFFRWVSNPQITSRREPIDFYAPFGVHPDSISGLTNAYLKILASLYESKPQTIFEMVDGYTRRFPADSLAVRTVAERVFGNDLADAPPEYWMTNRALVAGTTLFDQYRGLPRVHTFDLNAASLGDLAAVPEISVELAKHIHAAAPYASVEDITAVEGVSAGLVNRFRMMHADMDTLRAELESEEDLNLSIKSILMPAAIRSSIILGLSGFMGIWLFAYARRRSGLTRLRWYRLLWNGLLLSIVGCLGGWVFGLWGLGSIGAVFLLCGVPASIVHLVRRERPQAGLVLMAWMLAAIPAAILTGVWF